MTLYLLPLPVPLLPLQDSNQDDEEADKEKGHD